MLFYHSAQDITLFLQQYHNNHRNFTGTFCETIRLKKRITRLIQ